MAWEDVAYLLEPLDHPHVTGLLTAFGQAYANGGMLVRSFRPTDEAAFDNAFRRDQSPLDTMFGTFLTRPSVIAALPELRISVPLAVPPCFQWLSALGIEGQLTHLLLQGGAYERFRGSVAQARRLTRRFMEALFGRDLHHVSWAGASSAPWSPWFCEIAWDATYVLVDPRSRRFVLMCLTDTD